VAIDLSKGRAMAESEWRRRLVQVAVASVSVAALLVAAGLSPASAQVPTKGTVALGRAGQFAVQKAPRFLY
jgi:hypothetical protein